MQTIKGNLVELSEIVVESNSPYTLRLPKPDQDALDGALIQYRDLSIIESCTPSSESYYSTLFPRMKQNGTVRVIFNLKTFNEQYVEKIHFKMETIKDVLVLIMPHCYFASIDLKDAYFSVPIALHYRHMFRFLWQESFWQFTCLPQGFSAAPRIFTKLLKPVLSHLRSLGIQIIGYIDDFILIADCPQVLQEAITYALTLFDSLGLTVHQEKSVLVPTQKIEFLGFILDSVTMTISLTDKKKSKICDMAKKLAQKPVTTIRDLASLIGNVVAADPAVPLGPLRYKYLEIERNRLLSEHYGDYEATVSITKEARNKLQWWADHIHSLTKPIHLPDPDVEIFTDASMIGWGARCGDTATGGQWAQAELAHINQLELKAAFLAVQALCSSKNYQHVKIRSDNSTTVACINKCGSTKPALNKLTYEFLSWANDKNMHVSASHIPGVENIDADRESRRVNVDAEWMLDPSIFKRVCKELDFKPTIDMFATRINNQLPVYVSWRPDPAAFNIDALFFFLEQH